MFLPLLFLTLTSHAKPWNTEPATLGQSVTQCEGWLKTKVPIARLILLERLSRPRDIQAGPSRENIVDDLKVLLPESIQLQEVGADAEATFFLKTRMRGRKDQPFFEMNISSLGSDASKILMFRDSPDFGSASLSVTSDDSHFKVFLQTQIRGEIVAVRHTLCWRFSRAAFMESLQVREDLGTIGHTRVKWRDFIVKEHVPAGARTMQIVRDAWPTLMFEFSNIHALRE